MKRITVINVNGYVSRHKRRKRWKWIAESADQRLDWQFVSISDYPWLLRVRKPCLSRYFTAWRAAWMARNSQVIVTHGEKIAIWTGIFLRLLRRKPVFIAWGFTLPYYQNYGYLRRALLRFGLKYVDRFVLFSELEREQCPEILGLPGKHFKMLPWSATKPEIKPDTPPYHPGEYIAAIGGEGRDYMTLFKAMEELTDIQLVVVGTELSVKGLKAPRNVQLYINIPYEDAINIASHAKFMILPLISKDTACGHGSLITQFYLGKATIISDSDAMRGYVNPDSNALTYPAGNTDTLIAKIKTLNADSQLRTSLANAGTEFADTCCSEQYTVDYFNAYIKEKMGTE